MCPFALTYTFGRYARDQRQGWVIFGAMAVFLLVGAVVAMHAEFVGNPLFPAGARPGRSATWKARRRSSVPAVGGLFMAATTGTSTGAINAWHDSFQPIGGLVPLFNMELGEITPGGIGAGMYGMLVIGAILAVFIAGLMVGRTPEYLGKKVEAFEIKMAMLVVLVLGASILGFTAIASVTAEGHGRPAQLRAARLQRDPVRLLQPDRQQRLGVRWPDRATRPSTTSLGGFAMLIGRYGMIIPILALAGSMAAKRAVAPSLGTFPTIGHPVRGPADRRRHHRRSPHVLPGARAGSDRRAAHPERRKGLLMALMSG